MSSYIRVDLVYLSFCEKDFELKQDKVLKKGKKDDFTTDPIQVKNPLKTANEFEKFNLNKILRS